MSVGIGWRLTAWYTLTAMAVLAATSIVVLVGLRLLLFGETSDRAAARAQALAALVAGVRVPATGPRQENRVQFGLGDSELVMVGSTADSFVQIANLRGEVVNRSVNLGTGYLPVPRAAGVPAQGLRTVSVAGATPVAWTSLPLRHGSSLIGSVQVGVSLAAQIAFLGDVRRILVWVDAAAAVLSALVGQLLARKALGPVRAIVAAARRLDGANLDERLPETGPRDEIHEMAVVFNSALGRIAAAARVQREFVAVASHELRTPLAIIQGYADVLLRGEPDGDPPTAQAAGVIREEAGRMRRMVSRLLVLARGEVTEQTRWSRVDLAVLTTDVCESMQVIAQDRSLVLEAPDPVFVLGDPERLQQAVVVLVDNALKYTQSGGHVWVRATAGARPSVEVRDDGPGMSSEVLARLFDPFFRGNPAHSRDRDGFGLGLSIARVIAREHGGDIEVDSRPGAGSTFRFGLPPAPREPGRRGSAERA